MKHILSLVVMLITFTAYSQDVNTQLKEADNLLKQLKEDEALVKYKQISTEQPSNVFVLVKCAELNVSIGARQKDKKVKQAYYQDAENYADKALQVDSNNADADYAKALVASKLPEIESENKKIIEDVREAKLYADKALQLNPNHAKANYIEGRWHYDLLNMGVLKKVIAKTQGGLPEADIDSAVYYMEKCKALEPYFVQNYLYLAKAYKYKERPAPAIEVLTKLVRLPTRTADDAALKAEGKQMLDEMQ